MCMKKCYKLIENLYRKGSMENFNSKLTHFGSERKDWVEKEEDD